MKQKVLFYFTVAVLLGMTVVNVLAQGTAISYQGRLSDSGQAANANYDLRFGVYTAVTNGTLVSPWVTNLDVPVSNGVFTVTLNFGAGIFNGTANGSNDWLDVSVRTAGGSTFTTLTPRQPILPVPYALFATSASNLLGNLAASQIIGTVGSTVISGSYSNTVNFVNGTNTFAGTFSGNGLSLTNLNASNLATGTVADARLSSNVPLLNASQTFTGANTFNGAVTLNNSGTFNGANSFTSQNTFSGNNGYSGINTFTNSGNYFQGSFFGNGLVGWTPLAATSTNAMRDAGYLTLNSSLTTVTLPATASLSVDDIVRVSGGGTGGWLVKENTGQSIVGSFSAYRNGYLLPLNSPSTDCRGVAASADGKRMYAVGYDITGVYASSDGGETWNQVSGSALSGIWSSVACSANGKIVYAQPSTGPIQKSVNGGATWTSTGTSAAGGGISCTADGSTLLTGNVFCSGNGTYRARVVSGAISYSINSGSSWTSVATAPASGITCLAVSSDCTRMLAGVSNGLLYASSNLGATWTTMTSSNQNWSTVWMSADGTKLAGSVSLSGSISGGVYGCSIIPVPNTSNTSSTICGSQGSAVELQYIGSSQFIPVSSEGVIWSN